MNDSTRCLPAWVGPAAEAAFKGQQSSNHFRMDESASDLALILRYVATFSLQIENSEPVSTISTHHVT